MCLVKTTIDQIMTSARNARWPHEKMRDPDKRERYTYVDGPMLFLGQQICSLMQDAGFPAKVLTCYRSPEDQSRLYAKGRSKPGRIVTNARRYESAHQFYEAVDIVHPAKYWDVSDEYWETLAKCVEIIADKYGVVLNHGHHWRFTDSAHIELRDWREWRDQLNWETPNHAQLWERFQAVLPDVAKSKLASGWTNRLAQMASE